jgi:hypothetical protein
LKTRIYLEDFSGKTVKLDFYAKVFLLIIIKDRKGL